MSTIQLANKYHRGSQIGLSMLLLGVVCVFEVTSDSNLSLHLKRVLESLGAVEVLCAVLYSNRDNEYDAAMQQGPPGALYEYISASFRFLCFWSDLGLQFELRLQKSTRSNWALWHCFVPLLTRIGDNKNDAARKQGHSGAKYRDKNAAIGWCLRFWSDLGLLFEIRLQKVTASHWALWKCFVPLLTRIGTMSTIWLGEQMPSGVL